MFASRSKVNYIKSRSAPEFFTSVIGVFIAQNNVGIGTIVGEFSAKSINIGEKYVYPPGHMANWECHVQHPLRAGLLYAVLDYGSSTDLVAPIQGRLHLYLGAAYACVVFHGRKGRQQSFEQALPPLLTQRPFQITWPEALSLFIVYLVYCTIMKFNVVLEEWVKTKLLGEKMDDDMTEPTTLSTPMTVRINGNNVSSFMPEDAFFWKRSAILANRDIQK
ncbi:hypothetical protein ANCDUO_05892 [Ancylostoma duodenale]|uniref:Uncharacterized protein n=1 Tax=Ancylostoma duodenale TaxID=51022 RepID=A0A0C2GR69_9BILA|nr:hypothetical protein ANCDUO_05892 [Ancylostoma duodenale]